MGDLSDNFSRKDFSCECGCGFDVVDAELLSVLQHMRDELDTPVTIKETNGSACRCVKHNEEVGGGKKSQHLLGKAADINAKGCTPAFVYEWLDKEYPNKYGLGKYKSFTHIDVRNRKGRW